MKSIVHTQRVYDLPYFTESSMGVYSYFDLRRHPEKIDEIPELKNDPVLKSFVSVLNDPEGHFMTHGCAVARGRPGCEGSPPGNLWRQSSCSMWPTPDQCHLRQTSVLRYPTKILCVFVSITAVRLKFSFSG